MNLFRSEEHARNWPGFVPGTEQGILPLQQLVKTFSGNFFSRRRDPDYVSKVGQYIRELLSELAMNGPYWSLPPQAKAA
jgi:hypothetical protein